MSEYIPTPCQETVQRLTDELAEALSALHELAGAEYMGGATPDTCPCPQCVATRKAEAILKKHNIL